MLCPPTHRVRIQLLRLICCTKSGSISGRLKPTTPLLSEYICNVWTCELDLGTLFNGEHVSVCHTSPSIRALPATPEPRRRWDLLPLTSYVGQLSLLMCFFGRSRAAPADMAASCLGSVSNPFHSSIKSLGLTSTWQHDGWVYHTTFHQQADRGGGGEGPTHLIGPHTPVQTGRPCIYTTASKSLSQPAVWFITDTQHTTCMSYDGLGETVPSESSELTARPPFIHLTVEAHYHLVPFLLCLFSQNHEMLSCNCSQWGRNYRC